MTIDELGQFAKELSELQTSRDNWKGWAQQLESFLFLACLESECNEIAWPDNTNMIKLGELLRERGWKIAWGGSGIDFRVPAGGITREATGEDMRALLAECKVREEAHEPQS